MADAGSIDMLMSLGFSQALAQEALAVTADVEEAANLLLGGGLTEARQSPPPATEELKMTVVVDAKLGLSAGKLASQVAHAALFGSSHASRADPHLVQQWNAAGQKLVVLQADDLDALMTRARDVGVPTMAISDAGRTEVQPGTQTCAAFGPGLSSQVDLVTGKLSLVRGFGPKHLTHDLIDVPSFSEFPPGYTLSTWADAGTADALSKKWAGVLSVAGQESRPEYILHKSRDESFNAQTVWFVTRNERCVATCMVQGRILSNFAVIPEERFTGVEEALLSHMFQSVTKVSKEGPVIAEVTMESAERALRSVGFK